MGYMIITLYQWWSMLRTQRLHAEQWWVLSGLKTWHIRQYFLLALFCPKPYTLTNASMVPIASELFPGPSWSLRWETKWGGSGLSDRKSSRGPKERRRGCQGQSETPSRRWSTERKWLLRWSPRKMKGISCGVSPSIYCEGEFQREKRETGLLLLFDLNQMMIAF